MNGQVTDEITGLLQDYYRLLQDDMIQGEGYFTKEESSEERTLKQSTK